MQKTFLPSADLEGECIVANLEVAADGDQGAVPVDLKLCHGGFEDESKFGILANSLNPFGIARYAQLIQVLHHMCPHSSVR